VSQSTVTPALQQLEAMLGVALFRRLSADMELTVESTRFLSHARDVMSAVGAAQRARLNHKAAATGVVRVGLTTLSPDISCRAISCASRAVFPM